MKNKGGQFFLIAAVILVVVIVSVITISNYTSTREEVKLYDLGQEMGIESQQVIDSGTYSGLDSEEMALLMENFAKNYVNYIEEDKNIYFVFGNKEEIRVLGYQEIEPEKVCIGLNNEPVDCNIAMEKTQTFSSNKNEIDKVVIKIGEAPNEYDYQFRLKPGENFYFVIWREIKGEKHVVISDEE